MKEESGPAVQPLSSSAGRRSITEHCPEWFQPVTIAGMRFRPLTLSLALVFLGQAAGCHSARTERFDLTVHNGTDGPLTLSLAKDGPPYEPTWATPEDFAQESPRLREAWSQPGGMTGLAAGKTADVRNLAGRFDPGVRGYLRAYAGDLSISQMLSKSAGSPDRVDVRLLPGANDITIVLEGTHLKAMPTPPATRPGGSGGS